MKFFWVRLQIKEIGVKITNLDVVVDCSTPYASGLEILEGRAKIYIYTRTTYDEDLQPGKFNFTSSIRTDVYIRPG